MKTVFFWFLWSILVGTGALWVWKRVIHHVKAYLLILHSGIYLAGIYVIYALVNGVPVW